MVGEQKAGSIAGTVGARSLCDGFKCYLHMDAAVPVKVASYISRGNCIAKERTCIASSSE